MFLTPSHFNFCQKPFLFNFWNGVDLPASHLDNVFKYTVFFFWRLPLRHQIFGPKILLDPNFSWTNNILVQQFIGTKISLDPKSFATNFFLGPRLFVDQIFFLTHAFFPQFSFDKVYLDSKSSFHSTFFGHIMFIKPNYFWPKSLPSKDRVSELNIDYIVILGPLIKQKKAK